LKNEPSNGRSAPLKTGTGDRASLVSANVFANVRYAPFAAPWNVAGWPAMTVPTGIGPDGLPRAAQLVGRPGSEATLLGLAAQLEQRRPWQRTAG